MGSKRLVMTPELLPAENSSIIDFRAPPPSPVASGRRSSFTNEDVLSEFLEHSLKVPDLVLPDRIFPRQKTLQSIPKLDFECLSSLDDDQSALKFIDSVSRTGCFEVFNHGISLDLTKPALDTGAAIFGISPDKRKIVTRSLERPFGFEEFHGEEEKPISEEFVWCSKDESLKKDMEGIIPLGYSNFSEKLEKLLLTIENLAEKILQFLLQSTSSVTNWEDYVKRDQEFGSICCLQKHTNLQGMNGGHQSAAAVSSLRYDVIRMLVRGSEFPHALCLHICNGAQEFHIYSKKGWISFHPDQHTLLITIGDQLQEWSRGRLKHVIGRPIFKGGDDQQCMSMSFMYSPSFIAKSDRDLKMKAVSIRQQVVFVILITILYQVFVYTFKIFRS